MHDAEYYVLKAQNGERWAAEDAELDKKLAALRQKHGAPPNIIYILWDDTAFGAVGFPGLQKNFGYETPNLNRMAAEGINFARMYSEGVEFKFIHWNTHFIFPFSRFRVFQVYFDDFAGLCCSASQKLSLQPTGLRALGQ